MKMKSLCTSLLAAALVAFPMTASAQVAFSVSGGPTFATFTGDDVDELDVSSKTGFFLGGSLGFPLSDIISFGTGAYYVQKGSAAEDDVDDFDLEVGVDYLEIPAVFQVQITGPDRPVGISLMAGPSFGFNLSCDVSGETEGGSVDSSCEDVPDFFDTKTFDLGLLFGAGLSFPTSDTMSFFVDGGIDVGLTNIADFGEDSEDGDIKNQAWWLGVGLSWVLGG